MIRVPGRAKVKRDGHDWHALLSDRPPPRYIECIRVLDGRPQCVDDQLIVENFKDLLT